jgi:hypothetical protein
MIAAGVPQSIAMKVSGPQNQFDVLALPDLVGDRSEERAETDAGVLEDREGERHHDAADQTACERTHTIHTQ